jgi:hypothetical protein
MAVDGQRHARQSAEVEVQAIEACRGENGCVVVTAAHPVHARRHVAADVRQHQIAPFHQERRAATQR